MLLPNYQLEEKGKILLPAKYFSPSSTEMQFLVEAFTINSSVACAFFPFVSYFSLVAYVGLDDGSSNFFTAQSVCMQCMHQFFIIIRQLRHDQLKWNSWWSFIKYNVETFQLITGNWNQFSHSTNETVCNIFVSRSK